MPQTTATTPRVELVADVRNATGESPVWHATERALYWTDIPARKLYRWRTTDATLRTWQLPEMLACLSIHAQGGWMAGMESGMFHLHTDDNADLRCDLLAPVTHRQSGMRFNDGRCDRQGRFLAGTMVQDMSLAAHSGAIYSYSGGAMRCLLGGFLVPNGMAFSPDGRTMYLSDSHPMANAIWAFDYDPDCGTPSRRRLWVDMKMMPGRPDGAAMDVDGCYWICGNDAGLLHRFTPDGRCDRSIGLPIKKPAMCAFGGASLDTLFVTSIRPAGVDLADQPLAGGLFALRPGVQGLAEPIFGHDASLSTPEGDSLER